MDKEVMFNENVSNYDKWRPTYCKKLFCDIIQYSKLDQNKKAIEVGIGTGRATLPFLMTGCNITAIEIGKNLAEYSRWKFNQYKNLNICNTSFEDFKCDDNSVDILYSGTAFHWIPKDIGYPKTLKLLKNNGTIALFWNRSFISREDKLLHKKIQDIYKKYRPIDNKIVENDIERYNSISNTIKLYGFRDLEMKLYHQTRVLCASDYISLLNTYPDHSSMPIPAKQLFESQIKNAIIESGNILNVYDTIDLYLARR